MKAPDLTQGNGRQQVVYWSSVFMMKSDIEHNGMERTIKLAAATSLQAATLPEIRY